MFEFFRRLIASENANSIQFSIADPKGLGDDIRSVTLTLSPPDDISASSVVSLYWTESKQKLFEKKFKNVHEAEEQFEALQRDLEEVSSLTKEYKIEEAKRLVESLTDKYQTYSDTIVDLDTVPKTMTNASKKEAKVVMQNIFFSTPEEAIEYQEKIKKNQPGDKKPGLLDDKKEFDPDNLGDETDSEEDGEEIGPPSVSYEEAEEQEAEEQKALSSRIEEAAEAAVEKKISAAVDAQFGDKERELVYALKEIGRTDPEIINYFHKELKYDEDAVVAFLDQINSGSENAVLEPYEKPEIIETPEHLVSPETREELVDEIINEDDEEPKGDEILKKEPDLEIATRDSEIQKKAEDPLETTPRPNRGAPQEPGFQPTEFDLPEQSEDMIDDPAARPDDAVISFEKGDTVYVQSDYETNEEGYEATFVGEEQRHGDDYIIVEHPKKGLQYVRKYRVTKASKKPAVTKKAEKAEVKKLAGISDDTPIIPEIVAETVIDEAVNYIAHKGSDALADELYEKRDDLSSYLSDYADKVYAANADFKKKVNADGDSGRDYLYMFMRHWLASELQKSFPETYNLLKDTEFGRGKALASKKEIDLIKGELKVLQLTADIMEEDEDFEQGPTEDDIVIQDEGQLGSQYGAYYEGKQIAQATEWDDLVAQIKQAIEGSNFMPAVFYVNDHGNVADVSRAIYNPEPREERPTVTPKESKTSADKGKPMDAQEFFEYSWAFYGPGEIYGDYFGDKLDPEDLKKAIEQRMASPEYEGDTFDREAVRDMLLADPKYKNIEKTEATQKKADEPAKSEVPVKYRDLKIAPKDKRRETVEPSSDVLRDAYSEFKTVQESLNSIEGNIKEIKSRFEAEVRKYEEDAGKANLVAQMQEYLNKLGALVDATESKNVRIGDKVLSYSEETKKQHKYPTYTHIMEILDKYPDARKAVQNAENALQKAVKSSLERMIKEYPHKESAVKLSQFDIESDEGDLVDLLQAAYQSLASAYKALSLEAQPV